MAQTTLDASLASQDARVVEIKAQRAKAEELQKAKQEEFLQSCRPLEEMLDSVRDIEGFPIGKDEDILALSDAPLYTACPNPYVNEFIKAFGTPYDEETDDYERKPFVSDVSEGKNDPIYNAHSYHTKVPHKAIMKFIEHYTDEGDIVFDGFCGTGMTGVAAQLLNRKAILSDLSPAATFIAYNYNTPVDSGEFEREAKKILAEVEKECGWMYETLHTDGTKGKINYTVWSDVFICPFCKNEYVFGDAAINRETNKVNEKYQCDSCDAQLNKRVCKHAKVTVLDTMLSKEITQNKQVPMLISYSVGTSRFEKKPDMNDLEVITKIRDAEIPYWYPNFKMMFKDKEWGDIWRAGYHFGITHAHHFYYRRNLWIYSALWNKTDDKSVRWGLSAIQNYINKKQSYTGGGGGMPGVLYIASLVQEKNVLDVFSRKINRLTSTIKSFPRIETNTIINTQSTTCLKNIHLNSIDYIFTDPPFGANIMYSEASFLWESWLTVFTNNNPEAIMNKSQNKELDEYTKLMSNCFQEYFRILKPNRWITVEFHNSKASVWNAIQNAITKAGFIIAQVTVLDKKQGSFKQVTSPGAVKNDLVINAYKPKQHFEELFLKSAGAGLERDFIEQHLNHLPAEPNIERSEQMLFSKMLAHYVQHGYEIKFDAKQFYTLLRDNFKLMDGFWFTDSQVTEYDEWKKEHGLQAIEEIAKGQQTLFISDEKSALIWLYNFLNTPKSYSDILTAFNPATTNTDDDIPELQALLETNFVFEDGVFRRPLNEKEKVAKEEQSEKELLKVFDKVLNDAKTGSKKIKTVRKEAVMLGFTKAYQEKRFHDIITVADKLKPSILEDNSEINDFVDIARLKMGDEF